MWSNTLQWWKSFSKTPQITTRNNSISPLTFIFCKMFCVITFAFSILELMTSKWLPYHLVPLASPSYHFLVPAHPVDGPKASGIYWLAAFTWRVWALSENNWKSPTSTFERKKHMLVGWRDKGLGLWQAFYMIVNKMYPAVNSLINYFFSYFALLFFVWGDNTLRSG